MEEAEAEEFWHYAIIHNAKKKKKVEDGREAEEEEEEVVMKLPTPGPVPETSLASAAIQKPYTPTDSLLINILTDWNKIEVKEWRDIPEGAQNAILIWKQRFNWPYCGGKHSLDSCIYIKSAKTEDDGYKFNVKKWVEVTEVLYSLIDEHMEKSAPGIVTAKWEKQTHKTILEVMAEGHRD